MKDLLTYSGGFTETAYKASLTLKRKTDKELEIRNIAIDNDVSLKNGDELHAGAILDRYTNRVEISGAVFRPGQYALDQNLQTVAQLIKKADGLREDAFKGRAILKRE